MRWVLFLLSVLVFFGAASVAAAAKSAIHEILSTVTMLIAAVLFCSAAIVSAIGAQTKELRRLLAKDDKPG